jgi:hypothetical protein
MSCCRSRLLISQHAGTDYGGEQPLEIACTMRAEVGGVVIRSNEMAQLHRMPTRKSKITISLQSV